MRESECQCKNGCTEQNKGYSSRYDAFFCRLCDAWLEGRCEDPNCGFCRNERIKPSQTDDWNEE